MDSLLNMLFPPNCEFCKAVGSVICQNCYAKIKIAADSSCIICNKPTLTGQTHENCKTAYSPKHYLGIYRYEGIVRECILRSKYNKKSFSLLRKLTEYGCMEVLERGFKFNRDAVIIPIPINENRLKERGFNQAEIIAREISKITKLKIDANILIRAKNTTPQHKKNREDRFLNLQNAFKTRNNKDIKSKHVLLVDDISTSGATLLEACKALYSKDIINIDCFIIAKSHEKIQ